MGYGFDSTFNLDSIPPALNYLMNEYKNEILGIKENQTSSPEIKEKWEMYAVLDKTFSTKSYTIGSYLLNTLWNQDAGYQEQCPIDPLTQITSKVGCGGVALGQILYYWGCRVFPDGSVSYLPDNFQNNISMNFYGQTYNWNTMHVNSPDSENKKLLYHSAVSIESDFGSSETSHNVASIPFALWNYWGFNSGTTKYKNENQSTWTTMLRNEIDNGRPIYYGGTDITVSPNKGHAWVVDGYQTSDNTYHCNWGWGGYENNWFTLTDLTPGTSDFNSTQLAVMGIYPKLDACSGLTGTSLICYPENAQYSVTIPSTASVSWTRTGNLTPVGATTNPTFTVSSTSNSGASGTITATIKNSHGQVFLTRTKTVWVGRPNNSQIDMIVMFGQYPYTTLCTNMEQTIAAGHPNIQQQGIQSFYWDFGSWSQYQTGYDLGGPVPNSRPTFYLDYYAPSPQVIKVKALNQCDNDYSMTYAKSKTFYAQNCFGYFLAISPNPADSETTLSIETTSTEEIVGEPAEWELEVYSPNQDLKEKKTKLKGSTVKIQTAGWKEGVYVVRIKYNNEILTGKLVVKK